jgi:hypothetical protein
VIVAATEAPALVMVHLQHCSTFPAGFQQLLQTQTERPALPDFQKNIVIIKILY